MRARLAHTPKLAADSVVAASRTSDATARRAPAATESEKNVERANASTTGESDPSLTGRAAVTARRGLVAPARATTGPQRPAAPAETLEPTDFRARLAGRLLVVTGDDADQFVDLIDTARSGLIIGGKGANATLRSLALADSSRLLAIDPWQSEKHVASEDQPFLIADPDEGQGSLFDETTLEQYLDSQIQAGAGFAVTPTGVMQAGDSRPMKAAIVTANNLDRDDTVLHMPLEPAWFLPDSLPSLIGMLKRSKHPVAISVADRNQDPYTRVLPALRQVVAEVPYAISWRVDLAGFDLMAHGAKAACIGVLPSKRAASVPNSVRRATDKSDRKPYALREELLRFVRTSYMQSEWYARIDPPGCPCQVCWGRAVDRYTGETASRLEAHRHNVAVLMRIVDSAPDLVGAIHWWGAVVADAIAEHAALGATIGRPVEPPEYVKSYL